VTTIAVGAVGIGGFVVALVRRRARRRRERRELVFSKASAGMWPPVPPAPDRAPRIGADLAGQVGDVDVARDTDATEPATEEHSESVITRDDESSAPT
jgi:hypothetical protein